jgi:protein NrfD
MAQATLKAKVTPRAPRRFTWQPLDAIWLAGLALMLAGLAGIWQRISQGLIPTALTSYVPWGLWVAAYDYLVWLEVGSLMVFTTLVYVFGMKSLSVLKPTVLFTGLVVMVMALLLVFVDLGRPERFWKVMLSPDFRSMITWMVWLHSAYLVLLVAKLWLVLRPGPGSQQTLKRLAWLSLPMGLALIVVSGSIFGVVAARPLWNTSVLPLMFFFSALASGGSLLLLLTVLFWPNKSDGAYRATVAQLARIVAGLLLLGVFAAGLIALTGLYQGGPSRVAALQLILTGPFWWSFWIVHLLLGIAIPLAVLISRPGNPLWVGVAAGLNAVTFLAVTLNIVIPVLVTPELHGLARAFVDPKLSFNYVPNLAEWLTMVFVIGLGALIYGLGFRWLPVKPGQAEVNT